MFSACKLYATARTFVAKIWSSSSTPLRVTDSVKTMGKPLNHIRFLLNLWTKGLMFNPARSEGLEFEIGGERDMKISLKPMHPDKDPLGYRLGLECKVSETFPADGFQRDFVEALIARRFIPYEGMPFALPYVKNGQEMIGADGTLREGFGLPFEAYPESLRNLCERAADELSLIANRFLKLLIWRLELDAPADFITHHSLYWRVSGEWYYGVSLKRQEGEFLCPIGVIWNDYEQSAMQALWSTEADEPLSHELLREANSLKSSSPRSSLLTLATALEIGIKLHVARRVPEAEWLIQNVPSPPIFQMFRKYLPLLHPSPVAGIESWAMLNDTFKSCQQLFEARNNVAHVGAASVDSAKLDLYFIAAADLLRIIDVLEGHEWAKSYASTELRNKLKWDGPNNPRMIVKMLSHDL